MPEVAAFTWIHRTDEHEACRKRHLSADAGDRDPAVLERLAHRLEHGGRKLRQLVEKEHARLTVVFNTGAQMGVKGV